MIVPVHPEAVAGDPATLRWRVPADLMPVVGAIGECPEPLAALRAEGVLRALVAEPAAVRLTLGAGHDWRGDGPGVRTALQDALALQSEALAAGGPGLFAPDLPGLPGVPGLTGVPGLPGHRGLAPADPGAAGSATGAQATRRALTASAAPADRLRAAVEAVLAGDVGGYLASHGGGARLVSVSDRDVELDLGGTCAACPARGITLHTRIETAVRALYPDLGEVRLSDSGRAGRAAPGAVPRTRVPLMLRRR